jgi:N-acetylmuramoyl-L-alanine amidase
MKTLFLNFLKNPWVHGAAILLATLFIVCTVFLMPPSNIHKENIVLTGQKNLYLLDAGHGYSPNNDCAYNAIKTGDTCFYEYMFNHRVVIALEAFLQRSGIYYVRIDDLTLIRDMDVMERVHLANEYSRHMNDSFGGEKKTILLSIHGNNSPNPEARGIEMFSNIRKCEDDPYCKRKTRYYAELIYYNIMRFLPSQEYRYDRENVTFKESNKTAQGDVAILKRTETYSYLIEGGFFSNNEDRELMSSDEYVESLARAIFFAICEIEGITPRL